MKRPALILLLALMIAAAAGSDALAFKQFRDAFRAEYAEGNENEAFVEAVMDANCYVCHQGKKKKDRNPYGQKLDELLEKGDKKDVDKIVAALKEVAEMHTVADDEESPTYGQLIAEGKLPGGDLETCKMKPEERAEKESGGSSEE